MATSFTIDQVKKKAADNGIFMSDADMALAARNPDAGMSIVNYKIDYGKATTDEERAAANKGAEGIRSAYGGYSGGTDGSKFYMDAPSPQSFTYADAPKYEDTYKGTRDELIDAIVNHKPFEYDHKTDPNYSAYAKMYRREGERATADALAKAAANTGGVASTAAVTAAQQAGNYYGSQLADKLPELYDAAYDRWFNEFTMKQNKLAAVQGESANERDKFLTELNQHNADRDFAYNQLLDSISHQSAQKQEEIDMANLLAQNYYDTSGLKKLGVDTSVYDELTGLQLESAKNDLKTSQNNADLAALELYEAQNPTPTDTSPGYTQGDIYAALAAIKNGKADSDDYNALLYAGYSPEELDSIASDGATSGLADELYTLASEYGRGLKGDIPLNRAVMLVHEAGDTDAAKEMFRGLFGDEVYNKHFGVASQTQVSAFVKQMVNQIPTKEQFAKLGYDMGGKYTYTEFVEEALAQAVAAHNMSGEDGVIALMLVEEREGI